MAIALGLIATFGAALRFHGLGDQSFWADEAVTREIAQGSMGSAWHRMMESESAPPLYYLAEWAWVHLVGRSDAALRSFSAVAGTLTIPVLFAAAHRLGGRRAGLIAAAIAASSPLLVWYSQEARAYSLYVLLCATSFWLFIRAREEQTAPSLAAWSLASGAAVATHYVAALLVIGEVAWLLAGTRTGRARVALAAAPVAALTAGMIPHALEQRELQGWILSFPLGDRIRALPAEGLVGITDPPGVVAGAALALVCFGLGALLLRGDETEKGGAIVSASLVVVPLAAVAIAALLGLDGLNARNLLAVWPPLAVLIAIAFATHQARWLGPVLAIALCGIGLGVIVEMKSAEREQRVAWRTAAKLIGPPRDRVIAAPSSFGHRPLLFYLRDQGGRARDVGGAPRTTELVLLTYQAPDHGTNCYSGTPCGMPSAAETPFSVPPGFHLVERRSGDLFTLARYRARVKLPVKMQITPLSELVRETRGSARQ
jgi:4-amino-4-deoxy-L-arabinose transferase-like glycosyltransferase